MDAKDDRPATKGDLQLLKLELMRARGRYHKCVSMWGIAACTTVNTAIVIVVIAIAVR